MRHYFLSLPAGRHGLSKEYLIIAIIAVLGVFAVVTQASAQTWSAQTSGTSNALSGVSFINATTGWTVGVSGTILTTTNGGSTWSAQTSGTANALRGVHFVSTTNGWAAGNSGTILVTTDGGSTWSAQTSGTANTLFNVFFVDADSGWVSGNSGVMLNTNDGATWSAQTMGSGASFLGVYVISDSSPTPNFYGWAVGSSGVINSTTNGGSTWSAQTSGVSTFLNDVYFVSTTNGWAVGDGGTILTTTDGGSTWSAQTSGTANDLNDVVFVNATTGWAIGDSGTIITTTNGGSTWSAQTSGTSNNLLDVSFIDSTTGWAVGSGGTILAFTAPAAATSAVSPVTSFEEQQRRLALRFPPNAVKDLRVLPKTCKGAFCPLEFKFLYEPANLHRALPLNIELRDDLGRAKISQVLYPPFISEAEYRLSLMDTGSNAVFFGSLCAIVGFSESCTPIQAASAIVLDDRDIRITTRLVDARQRQYRVMMAIDPLPRNMFVGATGLSATLMKIDEEREIPIFNRLYQFLSTPQVLYDALPRGTYRLEITPQNASGEGGQKITKTIDLDGVFAAIRSSADEGEEVGDITQTVESIQQKLLEVLKKFSTFFET